MSDMIRVEPARERRQCFARWAVAQEPKIRTADHNAFTVPAHLFTLAPECALIGALVDGRPYVPVTDGQEEAGDPGDGLREAVPGEPLPPLPESAYGPDAVPLEFAPLDDAPPGDEGDDSDPSDSGGEVQASALDASPVSPVADGSGPPFPCDACTRTFTTSRGRDTHRRQIHPDSRS